MTETRLGTGWPRYWEQYQSLVVPKSAEPRNPYLFPESVADLSQLVHDSKLVRVALNSNYSGYKTSTALEFENMPPTCFVHLDKLNRLIRISPEDQIVEVEAGTHLRDLNMFLRQSGFEIPIGLRPEDQDAPLASLLAMDLPHWNMEKIGRWRDLVLRMEIMFPDGQGIASGANVVKSVTGFDLHKLMIGARFTLGIITRVTLRIFPTTAQREFPPIEVQHGELIMADRGTLTNLRQHCAKDIAGGMEYYDDYANCLVLTESTCGYKLGEHHAWRSHVNEYCLPEFPSAQQKLMLRAKQIFDPTNKFNPGEFGFL